MTSTKGGMAGFTRRLTAWLERFASRPYATTLLFVVSVIEGAVAPIPPDVPFIALCVARPKRSFLYGSICVAGSTAGAVLGYYVGSLLYESVGERLVAFYNVQDQIAVLLAHYRENAWLTLILAGFTSIPFCIFTISAGFHQTLDIGTLFMACLVGRAIRFYLLSAVFYIFGAVAKRTLERSLAVIPVVVLLLLILGFLVGRKFF